jgi:hypothetical protein
MAATKDFAPIFARLKTILEPYARKMIVVHDTDDHYYLDTRHVMKNKHRVCFGAVRTGKAYVSYYLMPVYAFPDLIATMSPELKKRMQGKSCFNFKEVDEKLFRELAKVTRAAAKRFSGKNLEQYMEKLGR